MSSSKASKTAESSTPISGGSLGGVGTTTNKPMKDETDDSSPFQEGEHVLAFHGPWLYDAKVQKAELHMDGWRYYVHYTGWNKHWDEWLDVNLLLKYTEKNVQKQKELKEKHAAEKNMKPGRLSQDKTKSSFAESERLPFDLPEAEEELVAGYQTEYSGARGKKRKDEMVPKEECIVPSEMIVSIQIPSTLKKQLVDDHECITQLGQLVKLPRSPSVDEILNKYFDYRVKKDGVIIETIGEIVNGLRCYFDKALPAMLLYKHERQQYKEVITDNISPSSVYGAEHFLRLFVKLPEMLSCMRIEKETSTELQLRLVDLLRFLQSNQSAFFQSNYRKCKGFVAAVKEEDD